VTDPSVRTALLKTPDEVLALRARGRTPPALHEVRGVRPGLGVGANVGVCLVLSSVKRLRRANVVYRPLDKATPVSPSFISARKVDRSSEIDFLLTLIRKIYQKPPIEFGA
jgi:LysR family transcriptional regulator, benzoate and cis,cis-muconate-responsive activator of ben and cat genes